MSDIITVDGPGSSGKTTVANLFAKRIGYQFIDTGFIYRIFTAYVLRNKLSLEDSEQVSQVLKSIKLEFRDEGLEHHVFADGFDITSQLHHPTITEYVPTVAAQGYIRKISANLQREIGHRVNTVMTGRDIGTEIFPNAKLKFFITATPEIRARRRFKQLQEEGQAVKYSEILKNIKKRDKQDEEREVSPMRKPKDAVLVDTSHMTLEESVKELLKYYEERKDDLAI